MSRRVVLLRGVNLAKKNRISMPGLRTALERAGYGRVETYLQSGNVIVTGAGLDELIAANVHRTINEVFGLDITVLVRTKDELAQVVALNPLAKVATNPRRYIVTFLASEPPRGFADDLASVSTQEPFAIIGREVYSWHPDGVGRTPLWERLASRSLRVAATSRNWATVTRLLAMADAPVGR